VNFVGYRKTQPPGLRLFYGVREVGGSDFFCHKEAQTYSAKAAKVKKAQRNAGMWLRVSGTWGGYEFWLLDKSYLVNRGRCDLKLLGDVRKEEEPLFFTLSKNT